MKIKLERKKKFLSINKEPSLASYVVISGVGYD